MDLNCTVDLMNSSDYKDRFRAEYYQVKIRYDKLMDMLKKYKAGALPFTPTCSYELLFEQSVYMKNYMIVLEKRAMLEDIEL